MKGGVAAAVEAVRVLKETGTLQGGGVLLTAHELHEGPWGDKRQVRALIRDGCVGDAVLLPEYCASPLPIAGRGMAIFQAWIRRDGEAVHEVLRPLDQPLVVPAGAELIVRLKELHEQVSANSDPDVGQDSVFVGQIHSGEIYNQSPTECFIQGTRRWITPGETEAVEAQFRELVQAHAERTGTDIELDYALQGDAFRIAPTTRRSKHCRRPMRPRPETACRLDRSRSSMTATGSARSRHPRPHPRPQRHWRAYRP